jgi:hypothetical protein
MPPSLFVEQTSNDRVPLAVTFNFGAPEIRPCLRQTKKTAVMAMPEAAIHKNTCLSRRECHVGFAKNV